ncbi:MAG: SDR family NAD(P)-dependent oxidoreductase [Pseudomonadota bacterium]
MKIGEDTPAVISGGASGLGAATARHLASQGARVALLDLDRDRGAALAQEIGGVFAPCDMADPEAVASALDTVRARHGQERICISCAGIVPASKTVTRDGAHDPAVFQRAIGVNLLGTFFLASQSAAGMATAAPLGDDGARGVIITTSSIAAYEGQIGQVAYAASKAGVAGMTLPMARDLARSGIRVVSIAPGVFLTPMVAGMPEAVQDGLAASVPFPSRLGRPEEFAALAAHIVTNTMLNGEVIRLDGATRLQAK